LADYWRDYLGSGGRDLDYEVPQSGQKGQVPDKWSPIPFGNASIRRYGADIIMVSLGVGVHRAMEAALLLKDEGVSAEVPDLRTVSPLDSSAVVSSVSKTGRFLEIDEDYKQFGLSGEIAALVLENSIQFKFGRVCTESIIPYSHNLEKQVLPGTKEVAASALNMLNK